MLMKKGFVVEAVDIKDLSFITDLRPIVYDGRTLPFGNNSFDVVTILDVLHHAEYPEYLLSEGMRVGRHVIVMEYTYSNWLLKVLFLITDSILNCQLSIPRSYHTDKEWQSIFTEAGLRLNEVNNSSFLGIFNVVVYYLSKY